MNYHAHIYFDEHTRSAAVDLRAKLLEDNVSVGEVFFLVDKPVGPHPQPMFQISFEQRQYIALVDWLEKHRQGLSILIHPELQDELMGHTESATWLGIELEVNTSALNKSN